MIEAAALIAEARRWVAERVPFAHQGRSRTSGVDCAGFLEMLMRVSGELPKDYTAPRNYTRRPNGELRRVVERYCTRTAQEASRVPGSIVLICWPKDVEPSHIALCTGRSLIHAYQRVNAVVENGYRGYWVNNTHSTWLLPGVRYV